MTQKPNESTSTGEPAAVAERYARRAPADPRYSRERPDVQALLKERQRVLLRLLATHGCTDLAALRLLEVGCGTGGNLLEMMNLGFAPDHLVGLELLPDRYEQARRNVPTSVALVLGDALTAPVAPASQDIVLQSTVFTSLLDTAFQQRLADAMWSWLKPGGAVLWYDFTVDNPRNADVRGVPLARVRALFPQGTVDARRVTLAPPLARVVCRLHPALYGLFNALPLLRTHLLAWITKPL